MNEVVFCTVAFLVMVGLGAVIASCISPVRKLLSKRTDEVPIPRDPKNGRLILLSEKGKFALGDFEKLSEPEKVLRAINDLEMDVNNGGFNQYFINGSGDTAHHVLQALKVVGAHKTVELVARAFDRFPGGEIPRDCAERENLLANEEYNELWDDLDQEFFKYPDDLTSLVHGYVTKHKSEIADAAEAGF